MKQVAALSRIRSIAIVLFIGTQAFANQNDQIIKIPGGKFTPLFGFGKKETREYLVRPFWVDRKPVSRRQFLEFTKKNPEWSKEKINSLYSDMNYLRDFSTKGPKAFHPATNVSWYAADAYCLSKGGRLPSVLEWEYIAAASESNTNALTDPTFVEGILAWYSKPGNMQGQRIVGARAPNIYGVYDLHGLIWEWTSDFNSLFVSGDNRQDGDKSTSAICGGGAVDASSRSDYAAFMRYAMRSSLEASFSLSNLGFRCAYDRRA